MIYSGYSHTAVFPITISSILLLLSTAIPLASARDVPSTPGVYHLEISHPSDFYQYMTPGDALRASVQNDLIKFGWPCCRPKVVNEPVGVCADWSVEGYLRVDNYPFSVVWDTGSADLWVPAEGCEGCETDMRWPPPDEQVNPDRTVALSYLNGDVRCTGVRWNRTVSVGPLSATNVALIAVNKYEIREVFLGPQAAGVAGLGFPREAAGDKNLLIDQLISQRKLAKPEFSFFLGRGATPSRLSLGGVDKSLYHGTFIEIPLSRPDFWWVKVDSLFFNSVELGGTSGEAAIDTGGAGVYLDFSILNEISKESSYGFVLPDWNGIHFWIIPCHRASTTKILFNMGGHKFVMNPQDLLRPETPEIPESSLQDLLNEVRNPENEEYIKTIEDAMKTSEFCLTWINGIPDLKEHEGVSYLLGTYFMKNWYTKFNRGGRQSGFRFRKTPPSIGFAAANQQT